MTTTAKQQVVNAAMAHLGEPGFSDITQDPPSAALAKVLGQLDGKAGAEFYALSRHPWLCAMSYATLPPTNDVPANWKWSRHFLLPDTAVKLWAIDGLAQDTPYELGTASVGGQERQVIRCNLDALNVAYIERKPFEAYSADLCNYIAYLLASRTAGPLKSDQEGAVRLKREAEAALAEAKTGEAGQHHDAEALFGGGLADLRRLAG
ncbi:MAG: hypothetical protein DI570_09185 [Phenylobacterium zucineum]|nr:MAG: hypothetical protein DI570_09185 [Phenylobacterium zucineum]